jgi:8-oxo-dGTP pyrophosphatase MutT (NUDIX family)
VVTRPPSPLRPPHAPPMWRRRTDRTQWAKPKNVWRRSPPTNDPDRSYTDMPIDMTTFRFCAGLEKAFWDSRDHDGFQGKTVESFWDHVTRNDVPRMIHRYRQYRATCTVGCAAMFTCEGEPQILITRPPPTVTTPNPMWGLPGGKSEPGESPWTCCLREVGEELGRSVSSMIADIPRTSHSTPAFNAAGAMRTVVTYCVIIAMTPEEFMASLYPDPCEIQMCRMVTEEECSRMRTTFTPRNVFRYLEQYRTAN